MAANMSPFSGDSNAFDTNSEDWTYGKYLAASLEYGNENGKRPPSANMSVLFDNLTVVGAGSGATYQDSVGDSVLAPVKGIQKLFSNMKDPVKTILHGINGVVRAGEMLLVLGRPGSGCSTLLKNLAGFSEGYVRSEGDVRYNGVDVNVIKRRFRADVVYNAEGLFHALHTIRLLLTCLKWRHTFPISMLAKR
jgi:ABC-type multidrug transport system fused ATPase/permease subunit